MAKVSVYSSEGKEIEQLTVRDSVFSVKPNRGLLQEVVTSFLAARRESNAHAKTRAEVSGGGKKPWRQKGTGRARHGSSRSPIWRGGGVTFGPRNDRNYVKKVNAKARRKAVCIALSEKVAQKKFVVIDTLSIKNSKTKELTDALKNLPTLRHALLIVDTEHTRIAQAAKNAKKYDVTNSRSINAYDVLIHDGVIVTKKVVGMIEAYLAPKTK